MSASVMSPAKGQPAVLHLLPFSRNDAGATRTTHPTTKSETRAQEMASYVETQDTSRSFPVLAVTRSERAAAKLRSKSASVALYNMTSNALADSSLSYHRNQQRRLLRASSERLSRAQANQNSGILSLVKSRAKSEYGVYSSAKPETVKCSVRDINDEILGRPSAVHVDDNSNINNNAMAYSPEHYHPAAMGTEKKTHILPKPKAKMTDGHHWPPGKARFWRSSTGTTGDLDLRKHRLRLDMEPIPSGKKHSRRVKVNVNELPRSKTPIAENDPDKLNMKQVIAFLQSNSKDNTPADDSNIDTTRGVPHQRPGFHPSSRNPPHSKPAQVQQKPQEVLPLKVGKNGVISGRHYVNKPSAVEQKPVERMPPLRDPEMTSYRHSDTRPKSYHGSTFVMSDGKMVKSDYVSQSISHRSEERQRPKSLHATLDPRNIHIPESIRKLREKDEKTKPFRLHRFVTLVPNGSADLLNSPESKSVHFHTSRTTSRESSRSLDKPINGMKRRSFLSKRSRADNSNYIHGSGVTEPEATTPTEGRRSGKRHGRVGTPVSQTTQGVEKVICMPRAHFEPDSDEEGSPYPTMPNSRNRRAATLSAQGRAITPSSDHGVKGNGRSASNLSRPGSRKDRLAPTDNGDQEFPDMKHKSKENNEEISNHDENTDNSEATIAPNRTHTANELPSSSTSGSKQSSKSAYSTAQSRQVNGYNESPSLPSPPHSLPEWAKNEQRGSSPDTSHKSPSEAAASPTSSRKSHQTFFLTSLDPPQSRTVRIDTGAVTDQRAVSPAMVTPKDQVRLSLRKERHRTRELTYMVDMASAASGDDVMSKRTSLNSPG